MFLPGNFSEESPAILTAILALPVSRLALDRSIVNSIMKAFAVFKEFLLTFFIPFDNISITIIVFIIV